jgi:hypothetical protein
MRRRAPGEAVAQFRRRRVIPVLHALRDRLHRWVRSLELADAEPELPVEDRDADKWEPLVSIADAAGGPWPERARRACVILCDSRDAHDEGTAGERLLADLLAVWNDEDAIPTQNIIDRLVTVDEAPWADWYGKPITPKALAKLLHPFGIRSRNIVAGDARPKGYRRVDLEDAWTRYTHTSATPATAAPKDEKSPSTCTETGSGSVADAHQTIRYRSDLHERRQVADVAERADEHADHDWDLDQQLAALNPDDPDRGLRTAELRAEDARRRRARARH